MPKKGEPKDIPILYQKFLSAPQTIEAFRLPLLDMYNKKKGDKTWTDMGVQLVNQGIAVDANDAEKYLGQIAKIDWNQVYLMEQKLGRGRDEDGDGFLNG